MTVEEKESEAQAQKIVTLTSALLDSPAWNEYLVPRVEAEIQNIEQAILADGDNELSDDETRLLRRHLKFLRFFLTWPESDHQSQSGVVDSLHSSNQ